MSCDVGRAATGPGCYRWPCSWADGPTPPLLAPCRSASAAWPGWCTHCCSRSSSTCWGCPQVGWARVQRKWVPQRPPMPKCDLHVRNPASCPPTSLPVSVPLQRCRCLSWRRTRATPSQPPAPRCWCSWSQVRGWVPAWRSALPAPAMTAVSPFNLLCPSLVPPTPRRRERPGIPRCLGLRQPVHGCFPGAHPEAGHTAGGAHLQ